MIVARQNHRKVESRRSDGILPLVPVVIGMTEGAVLRTCVCVCVTGLRATGFWVALVIDMAEGAVRTCGCVCVTGLRATGFCVALVIDMAEGAVRTCGCVCVTELGSLGSGCTREGCTCPHSNTHPENRLVGIRFLPTVRGLAVATD
jgi:hypothetical protein